MNGRETYPRDPSTKHKNQTLQSTPLTLHILKMTKDFATAQSLETQITSKVLGAHQKQINLLTALRNLTIAVRPRIDF